MMTETELSVILGFLVGGSAVGVVMAAISFAASVFWGRG